MFYMKVQKTQREKISFAFFAFFARAKERDLSLVYLWFLLLGMLLFAWLSALPSPVYAQNPTSAVQMDVHVGFDGYFLRGRWVPITVIISNDGPDLQGVITWQFPGQSNNVSFQREIDLPQGARKRVTFSLFSQAFSHIGEVRFIADQKEVAKQQVRLNTIEEDQFTIGVLSNDNTLLNSLSSMQRLNTSSTVVLHLQTDLLPENVRLLDGLDAIFVHDISTVNMSRPQLDALNLWVLRGGHLVVSGGGNTGQSAPAIVDLLPVAVNGLERGATLSSLEQLIPQSTNNMPNTLPDNVTISTVELREGAQALDSNQLITTRRFGNGQVLFTRFDLRALRAWSGETDLWAKVLQVEPHFDPTTTSSWSGSLLRDVLQLPSLRLPSFFVLLLFILCYILIIGPLNFLILRRLRRVEFAWATIPAIVLVFVVGTYTISFFIRGTQAEITQVNVVQSFEGQTYGQVTTSFGIYSPRRNSYTLHLAADALVRSQDSSGESDTAVTWTDGATELRDMLIDVSSLRTFLVEQSIDVPITIQSNLRLQQSRVQGEIWNKSGVPLSDALFVYGNSMQKLGTIPAGERMQVAIEANLFNFPDAADVPTEGTFNRRRMLSSLFNKGINSGELKGFYLLAWSEEPPIDIQVANQSVKQHNLTLYVIRLQG